MTLSIAFVLGACGSDSGTTVPGDDQPDPSFEMQSFKNRTACSNKHLPSGKKMTAEDFTKLKIAGLALEDAQIYIEYRLGGGRVISSMLGALNFSGEEPFVTTACLDTKGTADAVKIAKLTNIPDKIVFKDLLINGMVNVTLPLVGPNAITVENPQFKLDPNNYTLGSWAAYIAKAGEIYRKGDTFQVMFNMKEDNGDGTNWFHFYLLRYKPYTPPADEN
jgi:hypothetical protein